MLELANKYALAIICMGLGSNLDFQIWPPQAKNVLKFIRIIYIFLNTTTTNFQIRILWPSFCDTGDHMIVDLLQMICYFDSITHAQTFIFYYIHNVTDQPLHLFFINNGILNYPSRFFKN